MLFGNVLMAQKFTISGTVTGENNTPLPGASIQVKSSAQGTISDSNGVYSLSLEKGAYEIVYSFIGYDNYVQIIELNKNMKIDASLNVKSILSDEIIVSAIKANAHTPVAKTNISKESIERNNMVADIPFQLELTPSVVASSENGTGIGYTSMRIRGTDMSRINVSVNGVPLNDSESQGVFWVNMPDFTSSVENIQIQRGVGTSTNGAAAFGASINFQTNNIEEKPYGKLSTTVGSFNTFKRNASVGTGLINDHFAFDLRYSKLDSDGWIKRGYSDHQSIYMSGVYVDDKNLLRTTILMGEEHTGITWWGVPDYMMETDRRFNPAGAYIDDSGNTAFYDGQSDNYWQNHYQLHYTRKLSEFWNANLALHLTTGEGYYEQYIPEVNDWGSYNTYASYGLPDVTIGGTTIIASDMIRQKWLDNVFYGYTFSTQYKKDKLDVSLGSSGNYYDGDHFGYIKWLKVNNGTKLNHKWYDNNGFKTDFMVFLKAQYQLMDNLFVYGDIQTRSIKYELEGPDDDLVALDGSYNWNFFNPKAGVFYNLNNNHSFFASYAMANREPTRSDIKTAAKDETSPAPMHETLNDFEFGYQYSGKNIVVGVNLFNMIYNDQLVNTGELSSVGYPVMTNVPDSYRRGIEISSGYQPFDFFRWDANFAYSQNKIKEYIEYASWDWEIRATNLGETDISYSPSIVASNTLTFKWKNFLSLSVISKFVGEQFIDNSSSAQRKLDSYHVHNLQISTSIPLEKVKLKTLELSLLVNNVLNEKYSSNAYGGVWYEQDVEMTWMYYYPQAPTSYMLKASLLF